jgi:hypothetical protein
MDLEMATDNVGFTEIAATFTKVTGKKGVHCFTPFEEYLPRREPYPGAPANYTIGPGAKYESQMTWRENFTAWWKFWGSGRAATRDMRLMDEIYPGRIKSLEEWMRKVDYQGTPRPTLKDVEDCRARIAAAQAKSS